MPRKHLNLSKSDFISEEDQSGCKSQNIAIRALKGSVPAKSGLNGPIKDVRTKIFQSIEFLL